MRVSKYEKALWCSRTHEQLLNNAVKGKKTKKGFAMAIYRVWCKMSKYNRQNPNYEVWIKQGHYCAENDWHVCWESQPYSEDCFFVSNEYFYAENYWSFSMIPYER